MDWSLEAKQNRAQRFTEDSRVRSADVLIVGAGPTGLTLAILLARAGVSIRIIDVSKAPSLASRGKGIQPRTLEIFENLGLIHQVITNGRFGIPIYSYSAQGTVTERRSPAAEAGTGVPYPMGLITPQWQVERALREKLLELGVSVEYDTELLSFDQSNRLASVRVGSSQVNGGVAFRWLVGCDGGQSRVRKEANIPFAGETRDDIRMIVADVGVRGLAREGWHMWRHAEGFASLCSLPSTDLYQYQASITPGQNAELNLANLQSILQERSGRTDIEITKMVWTGLWRSNARVAERYRSGSIFLAGDAAHTHSPAGGQGMNLGIQDAWNLGWKLIAASRGASEALLDSYEAERRPVALDVVQFTEARLQETITAKTIPTDGNRRVLQLDINYRDSALVLDDRGPDDQVRAGDRAPDASMLLTTVGWRRLFELMHGGQFTLINFGTTRDLPPFPSVNVFNVTQELKADTDIVDTAGLLSSTFGAGKNTILLLRPDGYIASISDRGDPAFVREVIAKVTSDAKHEAATFGNTTRTRTMERVCQ
jgi:2-polyprenyl-6-methoxyphenol hydroxylase-like FAD-dependent oxidoreductase